MKTRLMLATATVVMLSASAMAAEMPLKARPPAPAPTWDSCYVGVNGGWVGARSEFSWLPNPTPTWGFTGWDVTQEVAVLTAFGTNTLTSSGGTAGGEWGCNWQFGAAVFGYESDLEWTSINTRLDRFFPAPFGVDSQAFSESVASRWLSTSRFRAGVASGPWLFYATAGIAVARITYTDQVVFILPPFVRLPPITAYSAASTTDTKVGWTVGGGIEWLIFGNWSIKGEYLYVDLGRVISISNAVFSNNVLVEGGLISHSHNLHEQIARVGLNYQFNGGGAAPAY